MVRQARFVLRYIFRHLRRSARNSLLAVLLAALLIGAIGQLVLMRQSYDDLFRNTVVTARFAGALSVKAAAQLAMSEYTANPYYECSGNFDVNNVNVKHIFTCDIPRYIGEDADITYADGYDESCMLGLGEILIVGQAFFEEQGLTLGGEINVTSGGLFQSLVMSYMFGSNDPNVTEADMYEKYKVQIDQKLREGTIKYIVAGVLTSPSGKLDGAVFSPGTRSANRLELPEKVDMAEFTVADNEQIAEFRATCQEIIGGGATDSVMILDTGKIENIQNTRRLLGALYPIALAAALLIGGFLCCLLVLQSSKEAAIMRVLGTSKATTRAILSIEQLFRSAAGLLIGCGAMMIINRGKISGITGDLAMFAAAYIAVILAAAIVCSTLATRRSALELLQTKE